MEYVDPATDDGDKLPSDSQVALNDFWPTITDEIKRIKTVDARNQVLPLARIKKIMKLDEDVKMISAEAPLLFAKAAEIFIHELTLRAWVHTEDNKRRTLQRNDIAMAISKFDQFDFLIDIVPREEIIKQSKKDAAAASALASPAASLPPAAAPCDDAPQEPTPPPPLILQQQQPLDAKSVAGVVQTQSLGDPPVQYYLQLAQQHQQSMQQQPPHQPMHILQTANPAAGHPHIQHIQMSGMNGALAIQAPSNILLAAPPAQQTHQHIQLVQHIVTPSGEIQQVPIQIPQNQLNMLRMQMQAHQPQLLQQPQQQHLHQQQHQQQQQLHHQQQQQQPIIIQTSNAGGGLQQHQHQQQMIQQNGNSPAMYTSPIGQQQQVLLAQQQQLLQPTDGD